MSQQNNNDKNEIKQVQPVQSAQQESTTPGMAEVLEFMLRREKRQVQEDEEKKRTLELKRIQQGKNSQATEAEQRLIQMKCRHLKGGKLQKKGEKDFAVSMHVFINLKRVIRCHICRMKWKEKDTKEFLFREGKQGILHKYRNHTGIGWHEACQMLESSSNTQTMSEAVLTLNSATAQASPTVVTASTAIDPSFFTTPVETTQE